LHATSIKNRPLESTRWNFYHIFRSPPILDYTQFKFRIYCFIGFGALMVIAAGLPFVGGNQAAKQDVLYRPSSYMDDYKQSRQSFALSKWTMVMFLIGLPNLLIPLLVIHL